jgi:hypothetical protein
MPIRSRYESPSTLAVQPTRSGTPYLDLLESIPRGLPGHDGREQAALVNLLQADVAAAG